MKSPELIYATEIEEFFWKDTDTSVMEGVPVGIDIENGSEINFLLFEDIYWKPNYEEGDDK